MKKLKKIAKIISIFALIICFLSSCNVYQKFSTSSDTNSLITSYVNKYKDYSEIQVHFIDVGQGDSILVQVNNRNMLIDAGPATAHSKVISYLKDIGIKNVDYFITTHPHEDHIGGASYIIKNFNIEKFYAPKKILNTDSFRKMILSLENENKKINIAKAGVKLDMGENTICEMIAPNNNYYKDTNNYSSVIKLTYKNNKFLFLGDAEELSESEMLNEGYDVSSDVVKIGHHGSISSTSTPFLNKVKPKIAVISCGKNNDYGHPNIEVLNRLKDLNCKIYRTDLNGDIIIMGNGGDLKVVSAKQ